MNAQGVYYGNALQAAVACMGHLDIVKLLLDHGADVNLHGGRYGNALQAAVYKGSLDIVTLLLDHGADVNVQGGYYGNALQAAASGGTLEIVKLLLERGADVTVQPNSEGRDSLLHVATASNNLALLEILCNAGADVHMSSHDHFGRTPLHVAVENEQVPIAKYLLDRGASPDIEDFRDTNPFQLAMREGNRDMVLLLYPKTTAGLSTISASDWRRCSGHAQDCNLEMISDGSAKVVFRNESLKRDLYEMSYTLILIRKVLFARDIDFMQRHRIGKRIL